MNEPRDPQLTRLLDDLDAPDHRSGFWHRLDEALDDVDRGATDRSARRFHFPAVAAVILLLAGVVAAVALTTRGGDEPTLENPVAESPGPDPAPVPSPTNEPAPTPTAEPTTEPTPSPTPEPTPAPDRGTCSASTIDDAVINSGRPWSELAAAIQTAALSCDYEAVAALAADQFTFSFGGGTDFAAFLREEEEQFGYDPMAKLVQLLEVEPGESTGNDLMVWPAFFGCETECGMDVDELRRLGYTDDDIAGFREFGGYLGYRAGFTETPDGDWSWTFFVAGD